MRINSDLEEIQCPWLDNDKAKKMLNSYKKDEGISSQVSTNKEQADYNKVMELFLDE